MSYRKIVLFFALFSCYVFNALAQSPSCSAASQFYTKDSINVTTFGASTVAGIKGFSFQPDLIQNFQYCYPGKIISITNNGIPGQTTLQGLPRFPMAIAGRTGFVCILMGLNDVLNQVVPVQLPPASATAAINLAIANIKIMVDMSLANGLIPIVGTLQYVNYNTNKSYVTVNNYIKRLNAGYVKLVQSYKGKVYLADINAALGYDFKLYQADGLHPNAQGDKIISYVWFDAINEAIDRTLLSIGLDQNFPNPANSNTSTTIGFSLSQPANVDIEMYNIIGLPIKTITNEFYNSGYHQVSVALNGLRPGIYIYVMKIAGRQLTKKMIVVN